MCRHHQLPAREVKSARCGDRGGSVLVPIEKPPEGAVLRALLDRALSKARDARQLAVLQRQLRETGRLGDLVGASKPMQEVMRIVEMAAPSSASVLITEKPGRARNRRADAAQAFAAGQWTVCGDQLFSHPRDG